MRDHLKLSIRLIGAIAIMLQFAACASTIPVDKSLDLSKLLDGDAYRQSGASKVQLGCYGIRTSGPGNQMECTSVPKWSSVKFEFLPESEMAISGNSAIDAEAHAKVDDLNISADDKAKWVEKYKEKMKVATLILTDDAGIVKDLNAKMATDSALAGNLHYGRARIVTAIKKAYSHDFWEKNSFALRAGAKGSLKVDGVGASATVNFVIDRGGDSSIKLGDGTTIAYTIDRFCWKRGDTKGTIHRVTIDFPGPDSNACQVDETRVWPGWGTWEGIAQWFEGLFD